MQDNHKQCIDSYIRLSDIRAIQAHLIKKYQGSINCVQVMPLDEDEGLPLPQIYGSVLVEEDITALKKTRRPDEATGNKTLDSITEIFYVENKLARRIFFKGEAGHGKTVFCLKLIDTWSKGTESKVFEDSKHSGGSAKSKSQGHLIEIDENQHTKLTQPKYIDQQSHVKQRNRSRDSKKSLKSRIASWFTSRKLLRGAQGQSKSGKQSSDDERTARDIPTTQQHNVGDTSEPKQETTSNLPTHPNRHLQRSAITYAEYGRDKEVVL